MNIFPAIILLALSPAVDGGGPEEPQSEPKVLLRMTVALENSGNEYLSSKFSETGDSITYHLRSVEYLGKVVRRQEHFYLASASYIRSQPAGRDTPPARGHSYIVVFSPDFTVVAFCKGGASGSRMDGNHLMRDGQILADFDARDPRTRYSGFLIGDGNKLPYFFADRITDKQWADDGFLLREKASRDK